MQLIFGHRSLLERLRLGLLGLALLPLLVGFGISQGSLIISQRDQLYDQYQRRVHRASDAIGVFLSQAEDHLAQTQRFWTFGQLDRAVQERILRDIVAADETFNAIDYLSPLGDRRLRASRRDFGEQVAPHWREQEAVAQTIASETKNYSKVEINPATGEPSLILALPVQDPQSGRMVGMLVAELSLKRLWVQLGGLAQGSGDDLFVVSAEQRVIAHVNPSTVLAGTRYRPPATGVGIHRDLNEDWALVTTSSLKLPGNTLTAVLTRPLGLAFKQVLFQMGVSVVMLFFALLLALWLIRLMTRWLIEPIAELTQVARRISTDEKEVRVPAHFEGEVATLADTFNLMLDRLRHEQDVLEQRVDRRTQALASANAQALDANRMLQAVLDTIPVRIFWKSTDLRYLGCNQLFAEDAGKGSPQEMIGKTDDEMAWRAVAELYRNDDRQIIYSGQAKLGYEEPQVTTDGRNLWLRTSKVPLRDTQGKVIGVLGTYEDITESKKAEEELHAAKDAAERASRAKSLFLSSMSHELRTPLNAILGYAQLLQMNTELGQEVTESAQEIRQAGAHLLSLVNDILDLARIESGRMEYQLESLVLEAVLSECLSQNLPRAAENGITVSVDERCGTQMVLGDHRRLVQIFNNLLSNAIKYNRKGGQVKIACNPPVDGRCRIAVTDTGRGMSAQQISQLFVPFNRAGAEMSQIEGTGIGLVITKELVEGMGGKIGVLSGTEQGSTFWVELPMSGGAALLNLRSMAVPQQPAALAAVPQETRAVVQTTRPRVLVAEDYGPNQTILRLQLESLGCEVDMAGDGAVALMRWRKSRHDLILSDLNMPVMDGLALARAVRQTERESGGHVPIVGITAAAVESELKRCRDAGMDDALTKPIAIEGLRAVIERWVDVVRSVEAAPIKSEPIREEPVKAQTAEQSAAVFDLAALYQILGQVDAAQARELVVSFIESARSGLDALVRQPDDDPAVSREMHKQKSSARTVGALHYAGLAEALEKSASHADADVSGRLAELRRALDDVAQEALRLQTQAADPAPTLDASLQVVHCNSVLVVDDDVVVLKQMPSMLRALGVVEVLTATNGLEAILTMSERAAELDVVVCDLNMPEMDGVELIRRFGQTGFKGALILMSGADPQILNTASRLAELQGLRVLGQVAKPVMPRDMVALLIRMQALAPVRQRQVQAGPPVTAEAIREAMAREEFTVWFQPKVDTLSLQPTGLEALARWRRSDGSFVSPDLFITLAEREGLIGELSRMLVGIALREAGHLHEAGYALKLAINLSGRWLDDLHLPEVIMDMVQKSGMQARDLVLEVTETGVMEDLTTALDVLTRLRLKGFGLSIDDFGIGYSSFEQLGRIPFTEMKLDRSFVNKAGQDAAARAILESSMGMAQKLGLITVAEGVETQDELALVRELGCDNVQGYLIAKPMPVDELIVWLGSTARS